MVCRGAARAKQLLVVIELLLGMRIENNKNVLASKMGSRVLPRVNTSVRECSGSARVYGYIFFVRYIHARVFTHQHACIHVGMRASLDRRYECESRAYGA